jgi:exodeoxyribonuclease V alpha subunit
VSKLILLGDRDQLASVEAGAVLGDICDTGNEHGFSKTFCETLKQVAGCDIPPGPGEEPESGLNDCIVHLQKSYRFGPDSGIGAVGMAVNQGNGGEALTSLRDEPYKDISWSDLPSVNDLPTALTHIIIKGFAECLRSHDPREIFQQFDGFRILSGLREGPYGVVALNTLVQQILKDKEVIEPNKVWYRGRPVMITRNDYNSRLFNGDVGLVLPDPEADNDLRVFFPSTDGTLRRFHPLRLPEHETVYAMTVHKSQGSEFDRILLILPDRDSPVLCRELIYTGITRARKRVEIWGRESVFYSAISRRIQRMSGLRDALWSHSA